MQQLLGHYATGNDFTTPNISANTTYYVDVTSNGCTSSKTAVFLATINTIPTITSSPGSRCGSGRVLLQAAALRLAVNCTQMLKVEQR
jgi:hypothetical protein